MAAAQPHHPSTAAGIILAPYLTEKSSRLAGIGQYTFLVARNAEKVAIARAVAARYGVHPIHVTIVNVRGKAVRYGQILGRRSAMKKAIVSVKTGEKIPFGVQS